MDSEVVDIVEIDDMVILLKISDNAALLDDMFPCFLDKAAFRW